VLAAAEGSVEKSSVMGKDLLSLIVKANLAHDIPANQRLSDEEIVYQVSTFLLAGSETTSNGTSWCLWRLAQDPALQQRLRNELNTVPGTEPTIEELNLLPLLDNVVRETLRLDSPVPETIRAATVDCNLPLSKPIYGNDGNIVFTDSIPLQKGAFLIESFNVVHRNQEIWGEDADIFNPDRYDRPNCPALKVPGSWGNLVAFNGGTRNCMCVLVSGPALSIGHN
jgi:cytochrome P450